MKQTSKSTTNKRGGLFGDKGNSGEPVTSFDWGSIDPTRILGLIQLVTGRGGAIRFGYTRDGAAGSIGVYYGDDRDTLYFRPTGDPEENFGLIERTFESLPFSSGKAPGGKS